MISGAPIDWSGHKGETLRKHWMSGLPIREIGRILNLSDDAVKRGARILNLPARSSRRGDPTNFQFFRIGGAKAQGPLPIPDSEPRVGAVSLLALKPNQCRYPFGTPRQPRFGFCGARIKNGSPYCQDHTALCYHKRAEPQEAAA